MRTLCLFRHAKSSWDDPTQRDFDRPLAARGVKAAPLMGWHMRELRLAPDVIICSTARRTRETAKLALPAWGSTAQLTYNDELYEASADTLANQLRRLPDDIGHAMIIGHNPGLHELALRLTGGRIPRKFARLTTKFPTAALLVLQCDIDRWEMLDDGCALIEHFATPRTLGA